MGDFYQNGIITTLHNLSDRPVEDLEADLQQFSRERPMGLILPSLYSELEGEALPKIIDELKPASYLSHVCNMRDAGSTEQSLVSVQIV